MRFISNCIPNSYALEELWGFSRDSKYLAVSCNIYPNPNILQHNIPIRAFLCQNHGGVRVGLAIRQRWVKSQPEIPFIESRGKSRVLFFKTPCSDNGRENFSSLTHAYEINNANFIIWIKWYKKYRIRSDFWQIVYSIRHSHPWKIPFVNKT